ncbi:MAG: hypothetical protein AAF959_06020 [Cyanobacteria bacterium P01_D01_bin.56]
MGTDLAIRHHSLRTLMKQLPQPARRPAWNHSSVTKCYVTRVLARRWTLTITASQV